MIRGSATWAEYGYEGFGANSPKFQLLVRTDDQPDHFPSRPKTGFLPVADFAEVYALFKLIENQQ